MLILTRRVGESLIIDDVVKVTLLSIRGHQARFGIDAPKHVTVHREEIHQRIQQEKLAGAGGNVADGNVAEGKLIDEKKDEDS